MGKTPERITAENVKNMAGDSFTKKLSKEEIEFPYECTICKKRFKSVQGKNGHMGTHKIETIDTESVEATPESDENPTAWITEYVRGGRVFNESLIQSLAKEERVTFIIPEDPMNSNLNYTLGLNGQMFDYPVGKYIILPRCIVDQIKDSYKNTELAKRRNLVERNEKVQNALS